MFIHSEENSDVWFGLKPGVKDTTFVDVFQSAVPFHFVVETNFLDVPSDLVLLFCSS